MYQFNLPKYSKVLYNLETPGPYFHQTAIQAQEGPLTRLPLHLRIAPVGAAQIKPNADKMLLSREHKGNTYSFRTGLQPTAFAGWYLGNDYEWQKGRKIISMILCQLHQDGAALTLYYFHHFDKYTNWQRMAFANAAIPHLLKRCAV